MKPSLGRTVYCIYNGWEELSVFSDKVYALAKESFIVEGFGKDTMEDSWEWQFKDYGTEWFTSIAKAKKEILRKAREEYDFKKPVLIQKYDDEWVIREKGEEL